MADNYNTYNGKAYRYLSFDALFNTLENESLRFTRVDELNDPLDNSSYLTPINWNQFTPKEFELVKNHISHAFNSMYICCFCKEYKMLNSYLLWSHYGQSHSQVCFEFDFSKVKYLGNPSIVIYPTNLCEERNLHINKSESEIGLFAVTNKLNIWSYEEEIRLIIDITNLNIDFSQCKASRDSKYLFVKFDLSYVSKVIFGINASKFNELKTISLFTEKNVKPKFEKILINPINLELQSIEYVV